jgi:ATP-dependent DNA helicase RecG
LKAVTKEFENVKALLAPFRVGLLHGRLKAAEKEEVMAAFRANKIQALLATSLIEVGVDVPNAT